MNLEITHHTGNQIFRTEVNDVEAYLKYRKKGPTMLEYYVTFVPVKERRQGIGTALVEEALRYAQLNNYMIVPTCSFVADYMDDHSEFDKMRVTPKQS